MNGASVGGGGAAGGVSPATVINTACQGCGACLLTCPERAIRPAGGAGLLVLAARCTGCGECAEVCPADAIVVEEECVD